MRVWKHQTFLLWVIVVTACVAQLVKAGEYSPFAGLTAIPQDDKLSGQNKQQKNQKQDNNIDQRRKKKVQPKRKTPRPPPAPISSQEIDSPSSYNLDNNIYSVLIDQGETVSPPIPRRKDSGVSIQDTLLKLPNKKYSGLQIITDDIIIRNSPNQNNIHNGATQENSPISVNSADDFQELMSSADDAYDHSPIRRFSVNSETSLPPASLSTLNDFIYRLDTVYFFESLAAGTSSKPGFESFDKSLWEQYLSLSKNPVLFRQIPIHTSLNHLIFCLASVTVTTKQWLVDISEKRIIHIFNDLAASTGKIFTFS